MDMMSAVRFGVGLLGGLVFAGFSVGCDAPIDDNGAALTVVGGPPVTEPPPPDPKPEPPTYEVWCRHYCEMLDKTLVYSSGGSASGGQADVCYELRCAPGLVTPSTCHAQCDSLARFYGAACAAADVPSEPLCPESPADSDAHCRAGCPAL
jgi:hypothetical protein